MASLIGKIEPGDVIGRCRIIRELGRGGVGTVYLASHQTLQIEVALKILSPALSLDNPALAERFILEAQLAARIRHPNVIAVMDAAHDEATGLYFIVMEHVGGGALSWHLRHGPLPEAKALAIITGIAHALILAEENRIVHRDIKPDNIMLDLRGTAKLADLGLAKHVIDSRTSLTLGGSFMGTPAYMSPEQARDAKVADTRDDIYSLGATFYECLTGEPPFQGETPFNIMSELLTKPSPLPRLLRPEISVSSDLICRKMMAKTRNLRYADASALMQDLLHAQKFGDSGLDRLEAAGIDEDSIQARQEALHFGVETSADGVALVPEPPDDSEVGPITRPAAALRSPRQSDYSVFGAAALLVTLVTVATLVLVWLGPNHPLPWFQKTLALFSGELHSKIEPASKVDAPPGAGQPLPTTDQDSRPGQPKKTPTDSARKMAEEAKAPPVRPIALPVVLPMTDSTNTAVIPNTVPALPVNSQTPDVPTPAVPAVADTAFEARGVAENSLGATAADPTGRADLLKAVGKRDNAEVTPTTWIFYFFDKSAAGHARIVSVSDHKVVKNGELLMSSLYPYTEQDILPEDKLAIDSSQALQVAEQTIPNVTVSSSQMELIQQKNSVPMWKVTLWAKNQDGEEEQLGFVTILAEKGDVILNTLKTDKILKH